MPVARDVTDWPQVDGPPQPEPVSLPAEPPAAESTETTEKKPREFDPRYREPFTGLAFIGALDDNFDWLGHNFHIRTLTSDEVIAVGLITQEFAGTVAENRAYVTAWVSLAVQSVDEQKFPMPYQEEPGIEWAWQRYRYVKSRWYPYTIDVVYERCLLLEDEVRKVVDAMGEAFRQAG